MTIFLDYLRDYVLTIDKRLLLFCSIWIGILVTLNYQLGVEREMIAGLGSRYYQFAALSGLYYCAFVIPYCFVIARRINQGALTPVFWGLLMFAPLLFALKVCITNPFENLAAGVWGDYVAAVTALPFRLLVVLIPLLILAMHLPAQQSFWGMTWKGVQWRPYMLMLGFMLPLIVFASTQPDFLNTYPRLKQIDFILPHTEHPIIIQLLYEISYGLDFVTIELFFRGFLIFAFVRYVGAAAILPMAAFYCSIHFGKPLFECISSYFGGLILGIVAYRTQSIAGGLAVHLGVAWMMEIGGFLGNLALK